jgi:hypothetical protein
MDIYFYRTNNLINGKFYYGSHQCNGRPYLGSGIVLNRAIDKYGINNFEFIVLKRFNTRQEAFDFEDRFLKLYKISSLDNSYNIKDAGCGGDAFTNNPHKEEIRARQSFAQSKRFQDPAERAKASMFKDVSDARLACLKETWSKASRGRLNGRARKVHVKDKLYHTIDEAALGEALTRQQVKYRLKMDHYPDFKYACDG